MITVNYQKRKNTELFKLFEDSNSIFLSKTQNFIPIYTKFFNLNDTNYNSINLNNKWYINNIQSKIHDLDNIFKCKIKNIKTDKVKEKNIFFKMAPLLDPYKYLVGKYDTSNVKLFNLPKLNSTADDCNPKLLDVNNSAYVDGLFLFLTSQLRDTHKFIHGVEYYGSFLAIKNDYKINVFDDIDYLNNSDFFHKNKNVLFTVDDYKYLFQRDENKLKPITIGNDISVKSNLSIKSFDNEVFENIFDDNNTINLNDLNNLNNISIDLIDITNANLTTEHQVTLNSNSTCSSRSSYTNDDDLNSDCDNCDPQILDSTYENGDNNEQCEENDYQEIYHNSNGDEADDEDEVDDEDDEDDEDDYEEENINVTIPKFPVQVIAMECCENTFDDLILNNELSTEEWYSAFMQIIMILITYQKAFNFTHNDLHTNNVMYNETDKKYIYYCYKKKYYKVPTFGRIFKIIDFGRSIFKFDGKLFFSDSFQNGGDAATQYNTEPYFNEKKPRLEPNFSFDLCRLACSIFDYIIDDFEEIKDLTSIKDPVKRLIFEWCLDDKKVNVLYKNNGVERYPDFKLYKMIARCVHNHTPQAQLERPEFEEFSRFSGEIKNIDEVIDIDKIQSYI
jgi:hypothetical protein